MKTDNSTLHNAVVESSIGVENILQDRLKKSIGFIIVAIDYEPCDEGETRQRTAFYSNIGENNSIKAMKLFIKSMEDKEMTITKYTLH